MEVLSPVGSYEALIFAVRSGADAVYLGTKSFNARRSADNFDGEALNDAVRYAHAHGVKVYVTLNTIIADCELDEAASTVTAVANAGADAVIIQDLAMLKIVKTVCPDMPCHASTQMSVHNLEGAKELERLGFCRVVPARELSLEELKIIRSGCSLELEVFVHGALCMSVSGQCYLSSVLGQRSANRGLCAQPCRLDFKSRCGSHALSLKDLSVIDMLCELERIGINSAKIEGRMKRPEYVAMATDACKKSLAGKEYDKEALRAVFSRSGFTDGYLTANRTHDMFGYRTKEDVVSAAPVLKDVANRYRNEMPLIPIKISALVKQGENMCVSVTDGTHTAKACGGMPERALSRAADSESISRSLAKCGGTPFFAKSIEVDTDGMSFVAASSVNELRKRALDTLYSLRAVRDPYRIYPFEYKAKESVRTDKTLIIARFEDGSQICEGADRIILDYNKLYEDRTLTDKYSGRLIAELPTLMFAEGAVRDRLIALKSRGVDTVYAPNIYAVRLGRELGFKVMGGFSLNVINSVALDGYRALGLESAEISFECTLERFDSMARCIPCGLIVYGKMPLMTVRACPVKTNRGCEGCDGRPMIIDRMGNDMRFLCKDKRYGRLLNPYPIYMGDKLAQFKNASFLTVYFTDESKKECEGILSLIKRGGALRGKFTRGLYYKEIR